MESRRLDFSQVLLILNTLIVFAIFCGQLYPYISDNRIFVTAFDGSKYKVRNTEHRQQTADTLARMNGKVNKLIENVLRDERDPYYSQVIVRLKDRYRRETLSEGIIDPNFSSFTVNKGEEIVLCMRTRDAEDRIYDENLLFYVLLHELAHIACITNDHTAEFNATFEYLMKQAEKYTDFVRSSAKVHYCGVDVPGM